MTGTLHPAQDQLLDQPRTLERTSLTAFAKLIHDAYWAHVPTVEPAPVWEQGSAEYHQAWEYAAATARRGAYCQPCLRELTAPAMGLRLTFNGVPLPGDTRQFVVTTFEGLRGCLDLFPSTPQITDMWGTPVGLFAVTAIDDVPHCEHHQKYAMLERTQRIR